MPTCPRCERTYEVDELTHHTRSGVHYVHCPECEHLFGTYDDPSSR